MRPSLESKDYLFAELKRRKVFRVAIAYFFGGVAVLEAADLILPSLWLPESTYQGVLALVLIGFPVTLMLAWTLEVTPKGIRRERRGGVEAKSDAVPSPGWVRRVAILSLLAAGLLLAWRPWRGSEPLAAFTAAGFADSVAVLAIENRTGEVENDHVGAGITEEIVRHMQRLGRVKVIDPYSVARLLDLGITDRQLADSLGVDKLVRGSLYEEGGQLWLNAITTEASSGKVLWTERYAGGESTGHDAAVAIAASFGADYEEHTPASSVQEYASMPEHASSHDAVLEGQRWLGRRTFEGIRRARELFESAVRTDSNDPLALASLSKADALTLAYRYRGEPEGYEAAGRALALADHAVRLAPNLADGYAARGYVASRSSAPTRIVASDCRRALELEPGAADGLSWCTRVLKELGWTNRALEQAEKAISLDPRNAGRRIALAYDALTMKRYELAIEEARAARALAPGLMLPRVLEARALLLAGRARACAQLELGPHDGTRAACLYESGLRKEATAIVDSIAVAVSTGESPDPIFTDVTRAEDLAVYYAWTGDAELALSWVRMAYELSPSGVEPRTLDSALFDRVRNSAEFRRGVADLRDGIWERVRLAATRARW